MDTSKYMPACYCRVSTVHQIDKESIPAQVHMLTNYCVGMLQCKKSDIEFYIDAGYSGKNTKRPQFEKMMDDVESGKRNIVLAFKIDRISRNLLDFARFLEVLKSHNADFVSLSESFDTSSVMGQGMLKLVCLFGEMERGITRERVMAVSKDIISRGGHLGAPTPLGYNYDKGTKKYSINESEAKTIKLMFKMVQDGYSTNYIANHLNDNHITSKRGGLWTSTTVNHILHNPAFKGLYIWNRKTAGRQRAKDKKEWMYQKDVYPTIIPENEWQAVQDILKSRKTGRAFMQSTAPHFFSNLIICGECGRLLRYRSDRPRRSGFTPTIYTCPGHTFHWGCPNSAYLSDIVLAPFVLRYISNMYKLSWITDSVQSSQQLKSILLEGMPSNCRLANLSTIYGLFTRANTEPVPGDVAIIKAAANNAKVEREKELAKYYKALDRLKDLYLYGDSDLSKEMYVAERKKIELKIASIMGKTQKEEKQVSPKLSIDASKYETILSMLHDTADYMQILEKCGHKLLADFFHDCIKSIVTSNRQVMRITFRNGVSHNFIYEN